VVTVLIEEKCHFSSWSAVQGAVEGRVTAVVAASQARFTLTKFNMEIAGLI
jgi:hypothetical protein